MRLKLLIIALCAPAVIGAQAVRDSVITVTASRVTHSVPDRASFYVVVEGTAETAADAVTRVDTKLKAVTDALKALGSRAELDRPIAYSVGPTPAPNGYPGNATPPTNIARSILRVQTSKPDQVATIISAALTAGAASASGLVFENSAIDSVRRSRVAEVLASARQDADAISTALGGHVGALVDVATGGTVGFTQPPQLAFDNRFFSNQASAPEVSITTTITVRYRLVR